MLNRSTLTPIYPASLTDYLKSHYVGLHRRTEPPQTQSDSLESQAPSRNRQGLPARSRPSPPSRSCPAPPQRKLSRVPKRRRFRHSVPRLSSISDAWGRLNVVTPFHHLSGDSHLHRSLGAGPITASSVLGGRVRPPEAQRRVPRCAAQLLAASLPLRSY